MNLVKVDTKDRIVEAAVQLFSRQGYSGTSTRDIARLAHVNETSLFRYYHSKQEIFWAAMESRVERLQISKALQNGLAGDGNPEATIRLIVEFLVDIATYHQEMIWLFIVGFLELRPGTERAYYRHLAPTVQAITDYLGRSVETGMLRKLDPHLTATAFAATVLAHHGMHPLLKGTHAAYANTSEAIAAYSQFWLSALSVIKPINGKLTSMAAV
jgi:AcrR family transcriptional regulator